MSIYRFALIIFSAIILTVVSCDVSSSKSKIIPIKTDIDKATEGVNYNYTFQTSDPNLSIKWSIKDNPTWLSIGETTGELTGTPPVGFAKSETFEFTVTATSTKDSADKGSVDVSLFVQNTAVMDKSTYVSSNYFSNAVVTSDVDQDGDLDLIVANYQAPNLVLLNDGTGVFTDSGQALGNYFTNRLATADLNGDTYPDFIEVCDNNDPSIVWLNDGTGNFNSTVLPGNLDSVNIALADVDADGDLDFIESNIGGNRIFFNNGSGVFSDSGQSLGTYKSDSLATGDVDQDGDIDIVFGNGVNAPNTVWLNDGVGNFTDTGQRLGSYISGGSALADIDGDGDLDYMTGNFDGNNLVWLNDGSGTFFDSGQRLGQSATASINVIDIEGDGDVDIVTANYLDQPNQLWLNDGHGVFTDSGKSMGNVSSTFVAFGDFDGDGDYDIAFSCGNMYTATPQPVEIYINN